MHVIVRVFFDSSTLFMWGAWLRKILSQRFFPFL